MRAYILILLVSLLLILLSACSVNEEEKQNYSGIIGERNVLGYGYIVTKEQNTYTWEIIYKEDRSVINEGKHNIDTLDNFRMAVNETESTLVTLTISLAYILILAITTLIIFKKNRKILKQAVPVLVLMALITIYISSDAFFELTTAFKDVKYYYIILTN
ncbi:hypothetical protein FS935_19260 [Metabacillus litoralis]|uniref:Lipoprotein n=1 Tax=Metabacillus litoralis TaxID=152268 RepID=A0A5C6VQZ5_9BACI|nr:hypothetical protein [Metabacillus litoralis]TXC85798.1 hypothetical protein FS935_19260 [Metabacillus litoralis]